MAAFATSTRKAGVEMGTSMTAGAKKGSAALDDLGINAGTVALAVGTSVVMATANFEKAMSGVQAATRESAGGMDSLRQAALDAGATTSFSATEAAAGIENLAKAGVSTSDILGGALAGSLDLAAAGQISVADAAEYTATALTQFQLAGDQATHVADLLAAGAGKAQGEVSDMALALNYAGVPAANLGVSIEETAGTIALLAKNGIIGEKAGTALRGMLGSIGSPSKAAAKEMERLGISVFDAQGDFIGFEGVAGVLQERLSGLTQQEREQALGRIFGNEQAAAAGVFFREGAEGVAVMTSEVNDAGYAAKTAAIQLDNLKGDVEELKGALETAFIESGDDSQGMLRGLTQLATDTVNLTAEAEKADGALGTLWASATGAINPLGGLGDEMSWLADKITVGEEKTKDLDKSTKALTETTGAAAGGLDAQATATEGLGTALEDAEAAVENFKDLMDSLNAVLGGRADMRDYEAAIDDFTKTLKENGNTFDTNTAKGRENQAMLDNIAGSALALAENMGQADRRKFLTQAIADLRTMGERMGLPKSEIKGLIELLREANKADVNPKVEADTRRALQSFREVDQYLSSLNGKTATTYVNTVRTVTGPQGASVFGQEADGGVLDFYANGGMRENHVAQIAPAGAWRIWAEDETPGSAFIPRPRNAA